MSTENPIERHVTLCRSCGARIVFLPTRSGATMPVDVGSLPREEVIEMFDAKRMTSHYATCPQAARWRHRPGTREKEAR